MSGSGADNVFEIRSMHGQVRLFLDRTDEFAANMQSHRRDGLAEALAAINEAMVELAGGS